LEIPQPAVAFLKTAAFSRVWPPPSAVSAASNSSVAAEMPRNQIIPQILGRRKPHPFGKVGKNKEKVNFFIDISNRDSKKRAM
jgi:hypothetical protein